MEKTSNIVDIKNTIVKLKILKQLDTNMKLNTRDKTFVIDEISWLQGIKRLIRRDDRDCTIREIGLLVKDISILVDLINDNKTTDITMEELTRHILDGIAGLTKLKETYADDKTTLAKLEFEIETLEKICNKIKSKYD